MPERTRMSLNTSNEPRKLSPGTSAAVDLFMSLLEHPAKALIAALRAIITGVDARIAEGIKWESPSFRVSDYFATVNLRCKVGVGLIPHFGAKVRALPAGGAAIDDPAGLLTWLAADRAMVEFADLNALRTHQAALQAIIRQWIAVEGLRV